MQVYRCVICGDPYLGKEKPGNCPSCGVPLEYLALAKDWKEKRVESLSSVSRKNLEQAMELELKDSAFYTACSRKTRNLEAKAMFWALSKIAAEHAKIVNTILQKAAPRYVEDSQGGLSDGEKPLSNYEENIKEAKKREENAVKFYNQAASEAKEERVKEIFDAFKNIYI